MTSPPDELPMTCPVCGIADVTDTADGWRCRRCGSSDKHLTL